MIKLCHKQIRTHARTQTHTRTHARTHALTHQKTKQKDFRKKNIVELGDTTDLIITKHIIVPNKTQLADSNTLAKCPSSDYF